MSEGLLNRIEELKKQLEETKLEPRSQGIDRKFKFT